MTIILLRDLQDHMAEALLRVMQAAEQVLRITTHAEQVKETMYITHAHVRQQQVLTLLTTPVATRPHARQEEHLLTAHQLIARRQEVSLTTQHRLQEEAIQHQAALNLTVL